jgi:hypothetical protein
MAKRAAPIEWDTASFALVGCILGMLIGALFCLCQMIMTPLHDSHMARDPAIGGAVSALFLGSLSMIRNRIILLPRARLQKRRFPALSVRRMGIDNGLHGRGGPRAAGGGQDEMNGEPPGTTLNLWPGRR